MSKIPFLFEWCCEVPDEEDLCALSISNETNGYVQWDTSDIVTPTHLKIRNLLGLEIIVISPIQGVTQADQNNYHFKLDFNVGFLADLNSIKIGGENKESWSIYCRRESRTDSLYLLWHGDAIFLDIHNNIEVIIEGLAGQFLQRSNTTEVTISWQFKKGDQDIISILPMLNYGPPPPTDEDYANNITLRLDMVTTTGKSNIPLYFGFVGSNKVLNTNNGSSNLTLRVTNFSKNEELTFARHSADDSFSSQLEVELEVGSVTSVPWALGTQDQVNNITVTVGETSTKWELISSAYPIPEGGSAKLLRWTFLPPRDGCVLEAKDTLLINLEGIVTAHPTGETNLYLRYTNVASYKDGELICQIEKAPLFFDDKVQVGIGTNSPAALFHVFSGDAVITDGNLAIGTYYPSARLDVDGDAVIRENLGIGTTSPSAKLDVVGNAEISGNLGIGTTNPLGKLHVDNGNAVITYGNLGIGTTNPSAKLDVVGNAEISGNLGVGTNNPSAKLDVVGNAEISGNLGVGTSNPSAKLDVVGNAEISGNVGIGTTRPSAKLDVWGNIRINNQPVIKYEEYTGNGSTTYRTSEWQAAIIGYSDNFGDSREIRSIDIYPYQSGGLWYMKASITCGKDDHKSIRVRVLFIRKELFE